MSRKPISIAEPLISIGMPVFNGERFVRQAIESLLAQDYRNIELIVSDNASTDKTGAICRELASREWRIRYTQHHEHRDSVWNFNWVFQNAHGAYFMWASHDDFWDPNYLQACMTVLMQSGQLALVGTQCECVDAEAGHRIFVDRGIDTTGLNASVRFKHFRERLYSGDFLNSVFYGLYKYDILRRVMPLKRRMGIDQLMLASLNFEGEVATITKSLMTKRLGGDSQNLHRNARVMGIRNPFSTLFPYLVREIYMQRIIFSKKGIPLKMKITLCFTSLRCYGLDHLIRPSMKRWRTLRKTFKRLHKKWKRFANR